VERSIPIRVSNGLRADREWVAMVVANPNSVRRWDILVAPQEASAIDEREIAKAITFRSSIGLRSDEAWVRSLQADAAATIRYGIKLTVEEAAALDARVKTQLDIMPAIERYAVDHQDEWAGDYIDESGTVVVQVTAHMDAHRQAIAALFAPGLISLDVVQVRWTTAQLDAFNLVVTSPDAKSWLDGIGVEYRGGGSRVKENRVLLEIAIPRADAALASRVVDHFAARDWLTVQVDVIPAMALGFGRLEVRVVDSNGGPASGVTCVLLPDVAGAGGDETIRDTDDLGLCLWDRIHATGYGVEIWQSLNQGLLGRARVDVPSNGSGVVTVVVTR
jgi:hypothetical protein